MSFQTALAASFIIISFCWFLFWWISKIRKERIFESFVGIEPPERKDKKMINFMQARVDNIMIILAKQIEGAIDAEESFLKSNKKEDFDRLFPIDNGIDPKAEARNTRRGYLVKCNEITRTKKVFWMLHKIVNSYGFATKNGFKEYIEYSKEWHDHQP